MIEKREATVIIAKCEQTNKLYGIRMERKNKVWFCTWAFKLDEKVAKNEGYDLVKISGTIDIDPDYPGCPHCGAMGWFSCGNCDGLTCHSDEEVVKCSWCGSTGKFEIGENFDLNGSSY